MKTRSARLPAARSFRFPAPVTLARASLAAALAALLALPSAQATGPLSLYWDTNGSTSGAGSTIGTWGTDTYWTQSPGGTTVTTIYTAGSYVYFSAGTTGPTGVGVHGIVTANTINFTQTTPITLTTSTSNTVDVSGVGIVLDTNSGGVIINSAANPLQLGSSQTWTNKSSNDLSVSAASALASSVVLTLANNGTGAGKIHLTGPLANGTGAATTGLAVNSTNTGGLVELGGNTFTGGTTLTAGYVLISDGAAFGGSGNTVNFSGGTPIASSARSLVNTSTYNLVTDFAVGGKIGTTPYLGKITLASGATVDIKAYTSSNNGARTITLYGGNSSVTTNNAQLGLQTATFSNSYGTGSFRVIGGTGDTTSAPGIVSFEGVASFGSAVVLTVGPNATTVFSSDNRLSGNPGSPDVSVETNGVLNLSNGSSSSNQAIGGLYGAGKVLNNASSTGTSTLTIGGASAGLFSGIIQDSGLGHSSGKVALNVSKSSAGATQTLSGFGNTYTGSTTVTSGTLLVTGAHTGGAAYSVASGATLGGTGSIGSAINVSGTLSPGVAGIGTLTTGAVTFADGSTLAIDINTTNVNADLLVVNGGVTTGGSTVNLALTDLGGNVALPIGTRLVLASHTGTWSVTDVLSYGGLPVADGSTITLGNNTFTVAYADMTSGTASLTLTINPKSPYQSWIDGYAAQLPNAADRLPGADPDGDGLTNLQEFAFDGNPADVTIKGKISYSTTDPNAPGLSVTLAVRDGAVSGAGPNNSITLTADGIVYVIEGSETLTLFDKAIMEVSPASPLVPAPDSGWTARTFVISDSVGLPTARFLRVGVWQP